MLRPVPEVLVAVPPSAIGISTDMPAKLPPTFICEVRIAENSSISCIPLLTWMLVFGKVATTALNWIVKLVRSGLKLLVLSRTVMTYVMSFIHNPS